MAQVFDKMRELNGMAGMMDLDRDEVNAVYSYENYGKDGKFTKYN